LSPFESQSDCASAVSTDGLTISSIGKIVNLKGAVIFVLYGKPVIDDGCLFWNVNASMSLPSFKIEADVDIIVPCDDFKTFCRLAKRLMANISFRIVETFLILSAAVHFNFKAFLDAGKTLPSNEPTPSSLDGNESVVVDIWTGNLFCRERSGTSACVAEEFLNPVTS